MQYNLFINYYIDKDEKRQQELDFCVMENLRIMEKYQDTCRIVLIANETEKERLISLCDERHKNMLKFITADKRPTYNDYFNLMSDLFPEKENINILSNLDIIIPEETIVNLRIYFSEKTCLALSRWDIKDVSDYEKNSTLFERSDSQDTWIFKGGVGNIEGADFTLGNGGCDNSIAYLLHRSGYELKNPSKTLRTYHLHITNVRHYGKSIPPPYKLINPTK